MWQLGVSIALVIVLAVTFIVTFVLYHKTPAPKGCEHIKPDCKSCEAVACPLKESKDD